jgi:hypothetical protein
VTGEETVGGVPCVKLSARESEHLVTLWIGKDDHALRRVFERDHDDGYVAMRTADDLSGLSEEQRRMLAATSHEPPRAYTTEMTIDYAPVFDRPVDSARFGFTPPPSTSEPQNPPK